MSVLRPAASFRGDSHRLTQRCNGQAIIAKATLQVIAGKKGIATRTHNASRATVKATSAPPRTRSAARERAVVSVAAGEGAGDFWEGVRFPDILMLAEGIATAGTFKKFCFVREVWNRFRNSSSEFAPGIAKRMPDRLFYAAR